MAWYIDEATEITGGLTMSNAAGAAVMDEAATATNPTLIPNKAETDTGFGWAAADTLTAVTGGTEALRIDSSQNAGFGATPNAWYTAGSYSAVELNSALGLFSTSSGADNAAGMVRNGFINTSGDWTYVNNDEAQYISLTGGGNIEFNTATASTGTIAWGTAKFTISNTGPLYINESANTFAAGPSLTIQQGANDDEAQAWKSSDVSHPFTDISEADTYGTVSKNEATGGGLMFEGYKDTDGAGQGAVVISGSCGTTPITTKTTSGFGVVNIRAYSSTAATRTYVGADGNLCSIVNGNDAVRFIFDAEGSGHADVEWVAFDAEDDFQLVKDVEANFVPEIFGEAVQYKENDLVRLGLFGKDSIRREPNGKMRGMMNWTRMSMLHHGTIHKLVVAYEDVVKRLELAESKLKALAV